MYGAGYMSQVLVLFNILVIGKVVKKIVNCEACPNKPLNISVTSGKIFLKGYATIDTILAYRTPSILWIFQWYKLLCAGKRYILKQTTDYLTELVHCILKYVSF